MSDTTFFSTESSELNNNVEEFEKLQNNIYLTEFEEALFVGNELDMDVFENSVEYQDRRSVRNLDLGG